MSSPFGDPRRSYGGTYHETCLLYKWIDQILRLKRIGPNFGLITQITIFLGELELE